MQRSIEGDKRYWSDKTSSTDRPTGAKQYVSSFLKEGINIDDKANLPKIPVNNLVERSTVQRYDDIKNNWVNNSEYLQSYIKL